MKPQATTEEIRRATEWLAEFVTDELVEVLSEAARDDEAWREAVEGPAGFLAGRGIQTPDEIEVRLYEVAVPSPTPDAARTVEYYCEPPLVLQSFTVPIQECRRKAVVVSGREWDPDVGGFRPVGIVEICLVSFVRYETRWYCGLPAIAIAQ